MKILNQSVHVNEFTLHLLLGPLSRHTVAEHLVHPDQRTAARLQLLNNFQDQIHSFFHGLFIRVPFTHAFLKVNPFPLIVQSLQLLVELLQDRLVTASDRHDKTLKASKILQVTPDVSPVLYLEFLHQSQSPFSVTSSKRGIPPSPLHVTQKRKHVIPHALFK